MYNLAVISDILFNISRLQTNFLAISALMTMNQEYTRGRVVSPLRCLVTTVNQTASKYDAGRYARWLILHYLVLYCRSFELAITD